jgi:hypothetical protein
MALVCGSCILSCVVLSFSALASPAAIPAESFVTLVREFGEAIRDLLAVGAPLAALFDKVLR